MTRHARVLGPDASGGRGVLQMAIEPDVEGSALGAWCGIAAPLLLGTYLAVAARLRRGYDRTRDTMSALGDGVDVAAFGFLVVNVAVGVLLYLFARWSIEPEFGDPWLLIAGGAATSVLIGLTAGDEACRLPGIYGRPWQHVHEIHLVVVAIALVGIGVLPWWVWIAGFGPPDRQFRAVNATIAVAFVVVAIAVVVMVGLGRRQLRQRLIFPGAKGIKEPWSEPRVWLDRWGLAEYLLWTVGYSWVVAAAVATMWPSWVVPSTIAFVALASAATWWPQRIVPVVRFTVESCQQNTVYGLSGDDVVGEFRFYRIDKPDELRKSLRDLLGGQLVGEQHRWRRPLAGRESTLTVGVTRAGLDKLDVPYHWRGPRPDVFGEGGMWRRRALLGDDLDRWDGHWEHVHLGIWAYARDTHALKTAVRAIDELCGATCLESISARRTKPSDPALFNVRDGVSQPWILGVPAPSLKEDPRGGGKIGTWSDWQPLALGEFVLGQVDEANDMLAVPYPAPLFIGGTFAAVRKVTIDAERLTGMLAALSPACTELTPLDRLIGRKRDGTPLIEAPDDNRFRYRDDPEGLRCPITAHIRRANPRDSLGFDGILANRRRMIRRGLAYTADDDHEGKLSGLMFVALQARLDEQFEFVQRSWLNDGGAFGLGRDPDALAGHWTDAPRQVGLPGLAGPPVATTTWPVTTATGGAYFLLPSIRGLHYLAQGVGGAT